MWVSGWSGIKNENNYVDIAKEKVIATYAVIGQNLPLQSNVLMYVTSSSFSSKSKISKFSWILDFVTDFGMVITPLCTWYFNNTCAGVLLYFTAKLFSFSSSIRRGSPGLAHGLSGDPRGLYAVTVMPTDLQ